MEKVHGGELQGYLQKNVLSEADMVEIMRQLIQGIGYIHECGIIHRDLKPENILIETYGEDNFQIKITDFGLSRLGTPSELVFDACGTPAYVAPEVLNKTGYGPKVDLWSCGIILYSMISKTFPFHSQDRKHTFQQIKFKQPDFTDRSFKEDVSPECINFIKKLLEKDPNNRLNVDEALQHPFFSNKNMVDKKIAVTQLVKDEK